jgi:hypothetical protein
MQIGGYRITGFSPKFFVIVGSFLVTLWAAYTFLLPAPARRADPQFDPALSPRVLDKYATRPHWIDKFIADPNRGLRTGLTSVDDFTGVNFPSNVGLPLRMRVYLPAAESTTSRPDLSLSRWHGHNFVPALFIRPDRSQSLTRLQGLAQDAFSGDSNSNGGGAKSKPLMVGFPVSNTPPLGKAYEITGLLYWRSDRINPSAAVASAPPAAVVIADHTQPLSQAELTFPATHRAQVNLAYEENGQELIVHDIEWGSDVSNGSQMRACIGVTNHSPSPVALWPGFGAGAVTAANTAGTAGQDKSTPDPGATFNADGGSELIPGATAVGYLDFSNLTDPNQRLILSLPAPVASRTGAGFNNQGAPPTNNIVISIPPDRIKDLTGKNADTAANTSPCSQTSSSAGGSGDSSSGSGLTG